MIGRVVSKRYFLSLLVTESSEIASRMGMLLAAPERIDNRRHFGCGRIVLEGEGVIKTTPAKDRVGSQFYMELRRNEPAKVVLDLLESGENSMLGSSTLPNEYQLPIIFTGPEQQRKRALESSLITSGETLNIFLEELRS